MIVLQMILKMGAGGRSEIQDKNDPIFKTHLSLAGRLTLHVSRSLIQGWLEKKSSDRKTLFLSFNFTMKTS